MHRLYFHRILASQDISDYSDLHDPTAAELDRFLVSHQKKFHFVSSAKLCACLERGQRPDPRWIHLSMDDGFASSLIAADICASHDAPLTVFVTSGVLKDFIPWFTRRVAALAAAMEPLQFQGKTYDPRDFKQALALHDAIKKTVYAHDTGQQADACDEILRDMGLAPGPVPEKLRFMTAQELLRLAEMGVEIGAHGASHVSLLGLRPADVKSQLHEAKSRLEEVINAPVSYLSYPEGLFDWHLMQQARQAGYAAAFAVDSLRPDHLYCLGRKFVGRGMLASAVANSPKGVRPSGQAPGAPSPPWRKSAKQPLKIALLSFAPQNDSVYCRTRQLIAEAYGDTITVAKVNLNHEQARAAYPAAQVIRPAPHQPRPMQSSGAFLPKFTPWALLKRAEIYTKRASQRQGTLAQVLRQYHNLRTKGYGVLSALAKAPGRHRAWQKIAALERQVFQARKMRFPSKPFGPEHCQILLPVDGSPYSLADHLRDLGVDIVVQLGWGMVQEPLLEIGWGVLSWHHGPMPAIRGALTPAWAVIEKRPDWLGITLQRLEPGIDDGQIVSRRLLDPHQAKGYVDAYLTLDQWSMDMTMQALQDLAGGLDIISDPNLNPAKEQYRGLPRLKDFKRFFRNQVGFFGPDS